MRADLWARIAPIYQTASDLPAGDRDGYLDAACGGDAELRREVDSLLAQAGAPALIDQPAWEAAPDLLGADPAMSPGTEIGQYRVESFIGEGGMGQVYRARDTVLQRDVALKVLPSAFARDPDRLARFTREAQLLASLNHPHIGAIYGIERTRATDPPIHALVLELVDGPTLADRIGQGPLPLDEALPIARQIADAAEGAHDQGIIHRDLKPANVKLRTDGTVKVLDFGLAKALDQASPGDPTTSPTINGPAFVSGAAPLLGTAAYMSPERSRGRPADRRSDVWAFGCVLFEMITGTRAFAGAEVSDVLAAIVRDEPLWDRLPTNTPPPIARLLRRCLEKDPSKRLPSMGAARLEIDEVLADGSSDGPAWQRGPSSLVLRRAHLMTGVALVGGIALGSIVTRQLGQDPTTAPRALRFSIPQPPNAILGGYLRPGNPTSQAQFAASPDGRHIVVVANTQGVEALWIRPLDADEIRVLPGTEGARQPFWSPDSRSIAFFAAGKLKRVSIAGGLPITICDAGEGERGGTWNRDDVIVFASEPIVDQTSRGLWRVSAAGGSPAPATTADDPAVVRHAWPYFLPDGQHFLFVAVSAGRDWSVLVGRLGSTDATRIGPTQSAVVYGAGHIFSWKEGSVLAQAFDPETRQTTGDPFSVADGVGRGALGDVSFSVSDAGTVVHAPAIRTSMTQLTWFDRDGRRVGTVGEAARNAAFALSPDARRVVVTRDPEDIGIQRLWSIDTTTNLSSQLTFGDANSSLPAWSRDGSRLAFSQGVSGRLDIFAMTADGRRAATPLSQAVGTKIPTDWSPDGKSVLFTYAEGSADLDIWVLPLTGEKPFALIATANAEEAATFSPDGRWVAYQSNELGADEIFVQPFPPSGAKYRVSRDGGRAPQWRSSDGRELYFLGRDGSLMSAPMSFGEQLTAGVPVRLFATDYNRRRGRRFYSATSDGRRFLVPVYLDPPPATPLNVVVNWPATLAR